jgi:hypothetical protein
MVAMKVGEGSAHTPQSCLCGTPRTCRP